MRYVKPRLSFEAQTTLLQTKGILGDADVMEVLSFGSLVRVFRACPNGMQQAIAAHFGVPDSVFESWLNTPNAVRNVREHHGRLWNRVRPYPFKVPRPNKYPEWHRPVTVLGNRLFRVAPVLRMLLKRLSPTSMWPSRVRELLETAALGPLASMGFPPNWQQSPLWKELPNAS